MGEYYMKKYYEAYDERYKTVHQKGVSWSSDRPTPIVLDVMDRYGITAGEPILEIGCGEGRDSYAVLQRGYNAYCTDLSPEAITYCQNKYSQYSNRFGRLDCLRDDLAVQYDFVYAVAVVHMLVLDEDRNGFYRFIYNHLTADGYALVCSMGDGIHETQSDIRNAFVLQERNHEKGKMSVAGTSCRMVSFATFEKEINQNGFAIVEKGITASLPDFDGLMYAVIRKQ